MPAVESWQGMKEGVILSYWCSKARWCCPQLYCRSLTGSIRNSTWKYLLHAQTRCGQYVEKSEKKREGGYEGVKHWLPLHHGYRKQKRLRQVTNTKQERIKVPESANTTVERSRDGVWLFSTHCLLCKGHYRAWKSLVGLDNHPPLHLKGQYMVEEQSGWVGAAIPLPPTRKQLGPSKGYVSVRLTQYTLAPSGPFLGYLKSPTDSQLKPQAE